MAAKSVESMKPVAIIGAGLAGLALSLALHSQSIPSTIYEVRNIGHKLGGAIMLSPNALILLDKLGIYSRIREKGYNFEWLHMKTDENTVIGKYCFGSQQLFGYKALRIYRQVIIEELRSMCREAGIDIMYGMKFQKVLAETANGVQFEFENGSIVEAPLLIGTDGLHSKVRQYLDPDLKPHYMGTMAVAGAVKTKDIKFPPGGLEQMPVSIFGKRGAFVLAPQDVDGSESLLGTQVQRPEPDRATVEEISGSPDMMLSFLKANYDDWSDLVKSAMDNAIPETMYIWPFYHVPLIRSWISSVGKVVIIGDSAHALSPTLGQGANQAVEDAYSLALLLGNTQTHDSVEVNQILRNWQSLREKRINLLLDLTQKINNNRLPLEERQKLSPDSFWKPNFEKPGEEMRWLYDVETDPAIIEVQKLGSR
jgi:2-polyprenyl-6-methoxyphenol hydroxylase-like FAD-dependent oxidoreductase